MLVFDFQMSADSFENRHKGLRVSFCSGQSEATIVEKS